MRELSRLTVTGLTKHNRTYKKDAIYNIDVTSMQRNARYDASSNVPPSTSHRPIPPFSPR
jgi:hypothetical protein